MHCSTLIGRAKRRGACALEHYSVEAEYWRVRSEIPGQQSSVGVTSYELHCYLNLNLVFVSIGAKIIFRQFDSFVLDHADR